MRRDQASKEARRQRAAARAAARKPVPVPTRAEMKYRTPDSPADMLRFATELGWDHIRTKDGWRLTHPSGASACLHTSVSDKAAWRNLRSVLLRPTREAARG